MNLSKIIDDTFKAKLIKNINSIGIPTINIECILIEGSALYLKKANDIDFKVILKRYMPKAETIKQFTINGFKVECCYYTFKDWARVTNYKNNAQYISESSDMICIYGDDSNFRRFDIVNDKNLQKYVIDIYDRNFFNYDKKNKKSFLLEDKRLWNFLLFAFKVQNGSNDLTHEQLSILQDAHDLKIDKETYRPLFNEIKSQLNY